MQVEKNRVVRFHYTLTGEDGQEIESTREGEPIAALFGKSRLVTGLRNALEGRKEGDTFQVTVPPEEAYGERMEGLVRRVPKKHVRDGGRMKPGMIAVVGTQKGPRQATVVKAGMSVLDVDFNHPFAGRPLNFDVEVVEVREADEEEIAHGHVHGQGGHQH